ncbi:MAG: hypothetical protein CM15mP128_1200 [Methanobacteriota archaeon]|nr:MAG: hypothetical protein CM15mP128_1200 [Euryarchaeota archaeon]
MPYLVLALPVLPDLLLTLGTQSQNPRGRGVEFFTKSDMVVLAWVHILALTRPAGRHIWRRMPAGRPRAVLPCVAFSSPAWPTPGPGAWP